MGGEVPLELQNVLEIISYAEDELALILPLSHPLSSKEFIKKEFPKNYNNNKKSIHPAGQLAKFLNKLGQEGWELSETFELDKMLMIVFRREFLEDNNKENKN